MSHDPSEIILICSFGAQITFLIIIDIEKLCYTFVETVTFFRILWIFTRVALFDLLFNNVKVLSLLVKCNASLLNKSIYFCKKQQQLTHLKMIDTKINIYLYLYIRSPQNIPKMTKTPDWNLLFAHILLSRHLISGFHVYEYEILIHAYKTAASVRQRFGREAGCYNWSRLRFDIAGGLNSNAALHRFHGHDRRSKESRSHAGI